MSIFQWIKNLFFGKKESKSSINMDRLNGYTYYTIQEFENLHGKKVYFRSMSSMYGIFQVVFFEDYMGKRKSFSVYGGNIHREEKYFLSHKNEFVVIEEPKGRYRLYEIASTPMNVTPLF